ncbi:MAG: hypothetical protein V4590_00425 [Bacteroidota bacterium]
MKQLLLVMLLLTLHVVTARSEDFLKKLPPTFVGNEIIPSSDGGYVIAGSIFSSLHNSEDLAVIRTNAAGEILWSFSYGEKQDDKATSIIQTTDGSFVAVGTFGTVLNGTELTSALMLKIDATGAVQWKKTWGDSKNCTGIAVMEKADLSLVLLASTEWMKGEQQVRDVLLMHLRSTGETITTTTLETPDFDFTSVFAQLHSTSLLISTQTLKGLLLTMMNETLTVQWSKELSTNWTDIPRTIYVRQDSTLVIIGSTGEVRGGAMGKIFFMHVSREGKVLTRKEIGDNHSSVVITAAYHHPSGGYILCGTKRSTGYPEVYIVKLTETGDLMWGNQINGTWEQGGGGTSIKPAADGELILTGFENHSGSHDGFMMNLKSNGQSDKNRHRD